MDALGDRRVVGREAGEVACGFDAAILHVADERFSSGGKSGDKGPEVVEFGTDAGTEALVDEEGNLGAVGWDGSEVEEIGGAPVDLNGEVLCGGGSGGFGVDQDESLGGGGGFLLRESSEAGEGESEKD
jgi:hypothetical protein